MNHEEGMGEEVTAEEEESEVEKNEVVVEKEEDA